MGERFQEPAGKGRLRIQKLIDRCGIDAGHCDVGFRNDIYLPHNASEVRQFPKQVAGAKHGKDRNAAFRTEAADRDIARFDQPKPVRSVALLLDHCAGIKTVTPPGTN